MELNGREVDRGSLWIEDVDTRDYPDFSDAHFVGACFVDGTPLTDDEVEQLNTKYSDILWEMALDSLH